MLLLRETGNRETGNLCLSLSTDVLFCKFKLFKIVYLNRKAIVNMLNMLKYLVENKKRMRRKVPNRTSRVENHMLSTRDAL